MLPEWMEDKSFVLNTKFSQKWKNPASETGFLLLDRKNLRLAPEVKQRRRGR